jgi:uncharacterized protein YutE (UPF0331/DUF86 family)
LTDRLVVLKKLAMLREHVSRVRRRRPTTREAFESNVDVQDAIALSFLVAAQESSDIALHLAADEGWGLPTSYADAFDLLGRNRVLTPEHARELAAVASVRSRIAHGYASIDPGRLWDELPAGLDALDTYVEVIARLAGES